MSESGKSERYSVRAIGRDFLTMVRNVVGALNDHEKRIKALEAENKKLRKALRLFLSKNIDLAEETD